MTPPISQVWDSRAGSRFSTYWRIDMAVRAAVADGSHYISWNGWVYPIVGGHVSFDRRICLSSEIEGLVA